MFKDHTSTPPGELPLITIDPSTSPEAWPYNISAQAVELFEAMPDSFTFDELIEQGEHRGHSPQRLAEYLRQYEAEEMIRLEEERITKTGKTPYF